MLNKQEIINTTFLYNTSDLHHLKKNQPLTDFFNVLDQTKSSEAFVVVNERNQLCIGISCVQGCFLEKRLQCNLRRLAAVFLDLWWKF